MSLAAPQASSATPEVNRANSVRLDSNSRKGAEEGSPGNSAAASALIISTSGFGPTWRLTDGNTDDSPKDRLDLYDGKELL